MTNPDEKPQPLTVTEIYQAALKLSDAERELLLLKLTTSVGSDGFTTPEVRAAWAHECDRRYQDWQAGRVQAVPGDLVMQRLRPPVAGEQRKHVSAETSSSA